MIRASNLGWRSVFAAWTAVRSPPPAAPGGTWLAAAVPMDNPYCSCRPSLTPTAIAASTFRPAFLNFCLAALLALHRKQRARCFREQEKGAVFEREKTSLAQEGKKKEGSNKEARRKQASKQEGRKQKGSKQEGSRKRRRAQENPFLSPRALLLLLRRPPAVLIRLGGQAEHEAHRWLRRLSR